MLDVKDTKSQNTQGVGALAGSVRDLPTTFEEAQEKSAAISRALRRASAKARAPAKIISGGGGFRARKGDRAFKIGLLVSFGVIVAIPFLLASLYWGLIASKQYATVAKFTVRTAEASPLDSLGGLFGLGGGSLAQESQIVADYIRSRSMIEGLDASLNIRKIYENQKIDYFSRLKEDSAIEEFEKYWRKQAIVSIDTASAIITLDVRAFTAEDSLAIAQKILGNSEILVNDLSTRARRDALEQAKRELNRAEERTMNATLALQEARNAENTLDASASAEALNKIISILRLELSHAEQDQASQVGVVSSPQTRVLEMRIAAIKKQIEEYTAQIASNGQTVNGDSFAGRLSRLARRQVDLDIARQQYIQAAALYESARVNLETQHTYLSTFLKPTLPEKALYPRRWWEWSIIVLPCLAVWLLLSTLAFLVRDHMAK